MKLIIQGSSKEVADFVYQKQMAQASSPVNNDSYKATAEFLFRISEVCAKNPELAQLLPILSAAMGTVQGNRTKPDINKL